MHVPDEAGELDADHGQHQVPALNKECEIEGEAHGGEVDQRGGQTLRREHVGQLALQAHQEARAANSMCHAKIHQVNKK